MFPSDSKLVNSLSHCSKNNREKYDGRFGYILVPQFKQYGKGGYLKTNNYLFLNLLNTFAIALQLD